MSVYFILSKELGMVKIGFAKDPVSRLGKAQVDSPTALGLLAFEDGDKVIEKCRHEEFAEYRKRGEWFSFEGRLRAFIEGLPPYTSRKAERVFGEKPRGKELVALLNISTTYASDILTGKQPPSRPLAIAIFRATGWKHNSISKLTEKQIAVLEQIEPWERAA